MSEGTGSNKETAHYGTWKSPLSSDIVAGQAIGLESPRVAANGKIYYLERRSDGRNIIVEIDNGKTRDVLPENFSARCSVHEYGGAAYNLTPDGKIIFTDPDSKAVYTLDPANGDVKKILEKKECRYGDFEVHPSSKWCAAIEEDHTDPLPKDVRNRMVLIELPSGKSSTLLEGRDFYIAPRFSPDGKRLAWLEYNHPQMPWTGAELHVADFTASGKLENEIHVVGTAFEESATQQLWAPDGRLFFARDRTGYWQMSYLEPGGTEPKDFPLKGLEDADLSEPEWTLGYHTRAILPGGKRMVASYWRQATPCLISIDLSTGEWKSLGLDLVDLRGDLMAPYSDDSFVIIGGTRTTTRGFYHATISSSSTDLKLLKTSLEYSLPRSYISVAEHISCPTTDNLTTHGFYYAPKNPSYTAPSDTLPPLIVFGHGGPTGCVTAGFNLTIQYFTTRGYAVFDVNYRGSSGYGREYIRQLNGTWGIADPDDAAAGVKYLASRGVIDKNRAGVRGGSAGGYLTIQAVCQPNVWAGGNSLFGISDLRTFDASTHKFESKYLDGLLYDPGMTDKEKATRKVERSAISHPEDISAPLLLLQGSDDKIVPPDQATDLLDAAKKIGKEVELTIYQGEGHGFRKGENIKDALEREEKWWQKTLLKGWV